MLSTSTACFAERYVDQHVSWFAPSKATPALACKVKDRDRGLAEYFVEAPDYDDEDYASTAAPDSDDESLTDCTADECEGRPAQAASGSAVDPTRGSTLGGKAAPFPAVASVAHHRTNPQDQIRLGFITAGTYRYKRRIVEFCCSSESLI